MNEKISIPTDSEGYYSLECPYCGERFKSLGGDIDSEDTLELFCPSCGLVDESNSFVSQDVIEHAQTLAINHLKQQLNKTFKNTNRNMKGSGISFDFKEMKEEQPKELKEDEQLDQIELHCCEKTIKVHADQTRETIYCPFCGVN
ncbi:TFIIB-type zinc ribbon-containing protein [Pontibacillus sp. HMF3514]|uniref:TFIIB-type zinc ribbon-containing protein n=1 Tax=Pontibacillus sp. HMF3514 TaxID=2692425 RepID=UPI00131FA8BF|nr:TFIIB-type zinc ribbon-containing protein [Pontibacillus sp. HMF3514]QHE52784.1 hypothetical protein GS400_12445 [Pontibacillus sp. HMF3514]